MKREQKISVPSDMSSSNTVPIVPYQRKRRSQRLQACSLSNEELNKILEPFLTHTDQTVHKRSNTLPTNANNEVPTPTTVINDGNWASNFEEICHNTFLSTTGGRLRYLYTCSWPWWDSDPFWVRKWWGWGGWGVLPDQTRRIKISLRYVVLIRDSGFYSSDAWLCWLDYGSNRWIWFRKTSPIQTALLASRWLRNQRPTLPWSWPAQNNHNWQFERKFWSHNPLERYLGGVMVWWFRR